MFSIFNRRVFVMSKISSYKNNIFVKLSRECYKLRLAVIMHPPTLNVKLSRVMYIQ